MASARFTSMGGRPTNLKTEQFDMDSFFDFSQSSAQPSPATATSSRSDATPKTASQDWNALSPFDQNEERQRFNGPSHDYNQYRQQVGLPVGSTASIPMHNMYDGYDSGIGEMGFDSGFNGWSTGIDIDADVNMDFNNPQSAMPAMFFPQASNDTPSDAFIDPNALGGQEPTSNVGRLWPGMHSQQAQHAAMQKAAHTSALQQRQQKLQAQHAQYRQAASGPQNQVASQQGNGHAKRPSHVSEPHVEESISRLLNQMRHNSAVSNGDDADDDDDDMLPHIARMKKDEEDMDEDERLLASDEGKKLSSKERRQLRNKVSARAFRSRRKEYIGQLEGEVALKTQEATDLRNQNQALHHENDRYRGLIETLLRHPAFTPFINDISKDPSVLGPPPQQQPQSQQQQQHRQPATPAQQHSQPQQQPSQQQQQQQQQQRQQQQEARPEFMNFDASQVQLPQQQNERVGLATIPETDFSKLNINGFNAMNFNSFQSVNAFAVREVPKGPDPLDLLAASSLYSTHSASARAALDFANTTSDSATCEYDMNILLAKLDRAAQSMQLRGT